jgi:KUP system potassium uptake protein
MTAAMATTIDHETSFDSHGGHGATGLAALVVGALGIVYGDIGTSPIYAFREAFHGHGLEVTRDGALGAASLAFWALIIVISVKYLLMVMRLDNKGEGGILALGSLLPTGSKKRSFTALLGLAIFGTALLYGDGMITPAISVLSAVEGVEVATHALDSFIIPIAIAILAALFLIQKRGTGGISKVFGPIMCLWFGVIALLGVVQITKTPSVLQALNPLWAVRFFSEYHWEAFWALGSIFLVVTGGEALYADMGHFGRKPIAVGWFSVVFATRKASSRRSFSWRRTGPCGRSPFSQQPPRSSHRKRLSRALSRSPRRRCDSTISRAYS